tara:strand:- start:3 stop:542 length:540 start_codon:yes stop_codon:yes gene_type:complete
MGKVYKIIVNDKYYYGSTDDLSMRQARHNFNLRNNPKQKVYKYCLYNNISEIKCVPIYEGDDYLNVENEYIKNDNNCLNMRLSICDKERKAETAKKYNQSEKGKISKAKADKKYSEKNKEKLLKKKKEYYLKNKDKWTTEHYKELAKKRQQEKSCCDICGNEMLKKSINRHKKRYHTII